MSKHAVLSPSGSHRWMPCSGSVKAEEPYPDTDTVHTRYGTKAHDVSDVVLTNNIQGVPVKAEDFLGEHDEELDVTVDTEMVEGVQEYVDFLLMQDYVYQRSENEVPISQLTGEKDATGTADFIGLDEDGCLHVHDLKFGKGVKVFAKDNTQLLMYALGALKELEWMGVESVCVWIHQPRLNHIDSQEYSLQEMAEWRFKIEQAADQVRRKPNLFVPGHKQCRFCKHRNQCKARAEWASQGLRDEFPPLDAERDVKAEFFAKWMPRLQGVLDWAHSLEAAAFEHLESGNTIKGWKLVNGKASRRWRESKSAQNLLNKKMKLKLDEVAPRKLVTPAQAEKLVGKAVYKEKLSEHVKWSDGKPTMVPEDDPREAIHTGEAMGFRSEEEREDEAYT